jgi:hypothetical protein
VDRGRGAGIVGESEMKGVTRGNREGYG